MGVYKSVSLSFGRNHKNTVQEVNDKIMEIINESRIETVNNSIDLRTENGRFLYKEMIKDKIKDYLKNISPEVITIKIDDDFVTVPFDDIKVLTGYSPHYNIFRNDKGQEIYRHDWEDLNFEVLFVVDYNVTERYLNKKD